MSEEKLKSDVYDCLVQIELWTAKLQQAKESLATFQKPATVEVTHDAV